MSPRFSAAMGIRAAWLVAMIAVLVFWVTATMSNSAWAPQATENGEWHLLAALILVALTFPLGLIWVGLLNVGAYFLDAFNYRGGIDDELLIPIVWLGFVAVGYLQWFKLVPWVWRTWKEKRAKNRAPPA